MKRGQIHLQYALVRFVDQSFPEEKPGDAIEQIRYGLTHRPTHDAAEHRDPQIALQRPCECIPDNQTIDQSGVSCGKAQSYRSSPILNHQSK